MHAAHGRQLKRRSQRHGFQSGRGKMGPRRGWLDQTAAFNPEKHQQWRPGRVLAGRTGQSDENVATCQKTLGQRPSDIGNKVKLQACSATILRLFPLQAKVWGAGTALLPMPGCASQGSRRAGRRPSWNWNASGGLRARRARTQRERARGARGTSGRRASWAFLGDRNLSLRQTGRRQAPDERRGATGSRPARQGKTAISLLASQLCLESGQLFRAAGCLGWCQQLKAK